MEPDDRDLSREPSLSASFPSSNAFSPVFLEHASTSSGIAAVGLISGLQERLQANDPYPLSGSHVCFLARRFAEVTNSKAAISGIWRPKHLNGSFTAGYAQKTRSGSSSLPIQNDSKTVLRPKAFLVS
jgi:hypothetical protein